MASKVQKISIALPKEMIADIRYAVDSGQYATTSEVIREAVREWKGKERPLPASYPYARNMDELRRMAQEGLDSLRLSKAKPMDAVFDRLDAKLKKLADEQKRAKRRR